MRKIDNMSNDAYHSHKDYVSSSFIKGVAKHSVAKALKDAEEMSKNPSKALLDGAAFHTLMEGDKAFNSEYEVFNDSKAIERILKKRPTLKNVYMTNDYKAFLDECNNACLDIGKKPVFTSDVASWVKMKVSINTNEGLHELINDFYDQEKVMKEEVSFFYDEPDEHGLKYRVRPDRHYEDMSGNVILVLDWKTCQDASYRSFKSDFFKYGYDIQAVFYAKKLGIDPKHFYFVAVEKNHPCSSAVYGLSDFTIENAEAKLDDALMQIAEWKKTGYDGIPNHKEVTLL
jgi:hypothetical protein